jgi:glycosyltransferase involved in cell wall biosynthesis
VDCLVPADGWVARTFSAVGAVAVGRYEALTYARRPLDLVRMAGRLAGEVRGLRMAIRRRRADRVVVVSTSLPSALVAARLERAPAIVYAAEIQHRGGSAARRASARLLIRATALLADSIVCCSQTVASQYPAATVAAVAPPPIDPDLAAGDRARGRARLELGDEPCVLVVGALSHGRGQDIAIRALAAVRRSIPDARLVVVGDPHPRPADIEFAAELRALAGATGVEDAVVFAGTTDAMADLYAAADVVVNPARVPEGFGRVAPEALVAGRPVVATRVGAIEEVLRDGVTAVLVPPEDPERLAAEVVRLLHDPDLATRLVTAGRAHALERYSVAADIAAWKGALEKLPVRTPRGR